MQLDWGSLMGMAGGGGGFGAGGGGPQQVGGPGAGMQEAPGGGYQPESGGGESPAPKKGGGGGGGGKDAGKGMQPVPEAIPGPSFQPMPNSARPVQGTFFEPAVPQYLQSIGQILSNLQGMRYRG